MNDLMIASVGIRRDAAGRYCLNDLHKGAIAAGHNARSKEPARFLSSRFAQPILDALWADVGGRPESATRNLRSTSTPETILEAESATGNPRSTLVPAGAKTEQSATQNLGSTSDQNKTEFRLNLAEQEFLPSAAKRVSALGSPIWPVVAIESGPYQDRGTWVVERLLYHYATWVNPLFLDKVVDALKVAVAARLRDNAERASRAEAQVKRLEAAHFDAHLSWPLIRIAVLGGMPYRELAESLHRRPRQISRAVNRMITLGLISPAELASRQRGPARRAALRRIPGAVPPLTWRQQLALDL